MKNILCYGDSNTYGWAPDGSGRFDETKRWPRLMAKLLGNNYHIIEEGLNGRTTVFNDPTNPSLCGRDYLIPCVQSHQPLDVIILMLGTNDMKHMFSPAARSIADGIESLVKILKNPYQWNDLTPPQILIVSPILIGEGIAQSQIQSAFEVESIAISKQLSAMYKSVADKYGCGFLDASQYADPSPLDNIHLDADGCQKLAIAVTNVINSLIFKKHEIGTLTAEQKVFNSSNQTQSIH